MKVLILMVLFIYELNAVESTAVMGKWKAVTQSNNNGTMTVEKEYLYLNADGSFRIVLLVSLQKGEAFVKDLEIKGTGLWRVYNNLLIAVVNNMEVPFAKEVYLISQSSLRNLAANFKQRFQNAPIRILKIKSLDQKSLVTENEAFKESHYSRF